MSDWRPLSASHGRRTRVQFQPDGSFIIHSEQNVDAILDHNKALRGQDDRGYIGDGTFRRVASIPNVITHEWLKDGLDIYSGDCQDRLAKKLNDPDNAYLRTAPGHIGVSNGVAR